MKGILAPLAALLTSIAMTGPVQAAEVRQVDSMVDKLSQMGPSVQALGEADLGEQLASALFEIDAVGLSLKASADLPNSGRSLRYRQTLNGIPIWEQEVVVLQQPDGTIADLTGQAVFDITPPADPPQPKLTEEEALAKAKEITGRQEGVADAQTYENEETELVYYLDQGDLELSYYVSFFTTIEDEGGGLRPTRPVYLLDADTGETLRYYDNLQTASLGTGPGGNSKTGSYTYGTGIAPKMDVTQSGNNCGMDGTNVKSENLNHGSSGPGTPWGFTCFQNTTKAINGAFAPLNDAQSFGVAVFGMFKDWYNTSPLTQKLHMRVHYLNNYENAFWNGSSMTFGDGATRFYPLVALDVSAHEVAHGFTEQHSGLIYQNQSGGMNEAFSDMAGEATELYYLQKYGQLFSRTMPDLETGSDIFKQAGQALRYMCDPPKDGRSIGHVSQYQAGMDVHYSSGVYNKAFCLLSKRSGWNVRKAFDVFLVANQSYWTANETFQTGAEKVLRATQTLQYPTADVIWAFDQVGIPLAAQVKNKYLRTTLRVINDGNPRGCAYGDWNCMTRICKADLADQSAWRGWAGCWRKGNNFICYFECGRVATFQ